ncbi:MAG: hypothetical protein H6622_02830 [Halobacteriovoraceae bacterium]|nr:hypothetical protein [Halobacteriovoraceae bacterium]
MNNKGSTLLQVIVLMALVNGAALYNNYRNKARVNQDIKLNQAKIIDDTIKEIHQILADVEKCAVARDNSFQSLPGFDSIPKVLSENDEARISLTKIEKIPDPDAPGPREYLLDLTFEKYIDKKSAPLAIKKSVKVLDLTIEDEANNSGKEVCTSFETDGQEESISTFCELTASEIEENTGKCKYTELLDTPFKTRIYKLACDSIGGVIVNGKCNKINIDGLIQTINLKKDSITLNGTQRTDFLDSYCSTPGEVPTGISPDSKVLDCMPLPCNPMPGAVSTWKIVESSTAFKCKCIRDRPSGGISCGGNDYNSCDDYQVDDGCGTNTTCLIHGKKDCPCEPVVTFGACNCSTMQREQRSQCPGQNAQVSNVPCDANNNCGGGGGAGCTPVVTYGSCDCANIVNSRGSQTVTTSCTGQPDIVTSQECRCCLGRLMIWNMAGNSIECKALSESGNPGDSKQIYDNSSSGGYPGTGSLKVECRNPPDTWGNPQWYSVSGSEICN